MDTLGPLSERASVGNGPGGLQRRWRCVELFYPRPRPLAGLSLGRRRSGGGLRRASTVVFCAGPLERQGPDSEGAVVRSDQQRRQPWRGRQRILFLPRQHADAFLYEVSV